MNPLDIAQSVFIILLIAWNLSIVGGVNANFRSIRAAIRSLDRKIKK